MGWRNDVYGIVHQRDGYNIAMVSENKMKDSGKNVKKCLKLLIFGNLSPFSYRKKPLLTSREKFAFLQL